MMPIRVHAPEGPYAAAVRELPVSTVRAEGTPGHIAVVGGPAWIEQVERAETPVVLVAGEQPGSAPDLERLRTSGRSVVLERRRLRRDLVDDALAGRTDRSAARPRLVVAECVASAGDLRAAVTDAVGWSRELAGPLVLSDSSAGPDSASALLAGGPDAVPVVLRATVADVPAVFLRVTAFGEVTTEVLVDEPGGRRSVTTADRAGRIETPARFESVERFTLRRALAALEGNDQHDDLADLALDVALADAIVRPGA